MVPGALPLDSGFGEEEPGISKIDERLVVSIGIDAPDSLGCEQGLEKKSRARGVGYDEGYVTDGVEHRHTPWGLTLELSGWRRSE